MGDGPFFGGGGALGTLGLTPLQLTGRWHWGKQVFMMAELRADTPLEPGISSFVGSFMNLFSKCLLGTPRCLDPAQSWGWWILASWGV